MGPWEMLLYFGSFKWCIAVAVVVVRVVDLGTVERGVRGIAGVRTTEECCGWQLIRRCLDKVWSVRAGWCTRR